MVAFNVVNLQQLLCIKFGHYNWILGPQVAALDSVNLHAIWSLHN